MAVPAVLLSGDHAAIERWRELEALRPTLEKRPDLLAAAPLTPAQSRELARLRADEAACRVALKPENLDNYRLGSHLDGSPAGQKRRGNVCTL